MDRLPPAQVESHTGCNNTGASRVGKKKEREEEEEGGKKKRRLRNQLSLCSTLGQSFSSLAAARAERARAWEQVVVGAGAKNPPCPSKGGKTPKEWGASPVEREKGIFLV